MFELLKSAERPMDSKPELQQSINIVTGPANPLPADAAIGAKPERRLVHNGLKQPPFAGHAFQRVRAAFFIFKHKAAYEIANGLGHQNFTRRSETRNARTNMH